MFRAALEPYRGTLVVACSGGADSVALAHATLARAREENSPLPLLVYVDHGLRAESASEGQGVKALAASFGAEAIVCKVEVEERASLEAAARDARYAALESIARERNADWVLLAHTASDQVETVLMRVLRGTGVVGLAGIPKERGLFARPLLALPRAQTETYCHSHALSFAEDPMNRDHRFTRARLRHHWLPALREENPQLDRGLETLAQSASDHRELLDWAAARWLEDNRHPRGGLRVGAHWQELPANLAKHALVLFAGESGVLGLEARHLEELLALTLARPEGSQSLDMPGARIERCYDQLQWNPAEPVASSVEVQEGYRARSWRAGDRMRPERLKGRSRKLSDLFGEAKIPRAQRSCALVVERVEDGEIVWAEHLGHAFGEKIAVRLKRGQADPAK